MTVTGYFDSGDGVVSFALDAMNEGHAARELHNKFGDKALGADLFGEVAGETFNSKSFRDQYNNIATSPHRHIGAVKDHHHVRHYQR